MDDNYFNGLIGSSVKVCGVKLADLSLWHLSILEAIDSPLLTQRDAGVRDILILLKVLQASYPETPNLAPRFRDGVWLWRMERSNRLAAREVIKLKKWFAAQMCAPVMYKAIDTTIKAKGASAPPMLALVAGLVHRSNERIDTIWNMRSSEARWYDVALAEQDGVELNISYANEQQAPDSPEGEEAMEMAKKMLTPEQFAKWKRGV